MRFCLWLTIFFTITLKNVRLECVCTESDQKDVICTHKSSPNQNRRLNMDSSRRLEQNSIPFADTKTIQIHCGIQELQFNSFEKHTSVKSLDLSQNSIADIPHNFFKTMSTLEKIDFSKNQITNLKLDTFNWLQKLKILNLSFNQITRLEVGVLDHFKELEKIYLNNNKIVHLPVGVFHELMNAKLIDVSCNLLTRIEPYLFQSNKLLETIDFSKNPLQEKDSLVGLTNLHQIVNLKLRDCHLASAEYVTNCINLKELDLSHNDLHQLPENTFSMIKELITLNLRDCKLSDLPSNIFEQNVKLITLDLSYNNFKTLRSGLLNTTTRLENLNISHNAITVLPVDLFQYTELIEIDLSYNELDTIQPDLLNMETLTNIHAQYNKITHLEDLTFATCNYPIHYINLMHNRLVFLGEFFFDWLANLEKIEIFGNPWDCKCFEELTTLLSDRFIDYEYTGYSDGTIPVCVSGDSKVCNYDDTNLTHYYEVYKNYVNKNNM